MKYEFDKCDKVNDGFAVRIIFTVSYGGEHVGFVARCQAIARQGVGRWYEAYVDRHMSWSVGGSHDTADDAADALLDRLTGVR